MRNPRSEQVEKYPTPKIEVTLKMQVELKCPHCGEVIELPESEAK